ncbi:hypothetical protein RRG08_046710 [Elysia crispata]|uniref:Uncharacterized protein n=1 Tax=Elysia crispata TaxID=231223 RepID=A0AAE0YUM5_9GAST|nr:hypothetical protein RRG08_046710 [Elysia crispata]
MSQGSLLAFHKVSGTRGDTRTAQLVASLATSKPSLSQLLRLEPTKEELAPLATAKILALVARKEMFQRHCIYALKAALIATAIEFEQGTIRRNRTHLVATPTPDLSPPVRSVPDAPTLFPQYPDLPLQKQPRRVPLSSPRYSRHRLSQGSPD